MKHLSLSIKYNQCIQQLDELREEIRDLESKYNQWRDHRNRKMARMYHNMLDETLDDFVEAKLAKLRLEETIRLKTNSGEHHDSTTRIIKKA